ncbi:MAG: hypothetical protein JXD21_02730 [Candidatus Omnitrophica bacterium]|nr:hypothetical protein [Candidatus Omnitrophota bacterium]
MVTEKRGYPEVLDYFVSLKRHERIAPAYLFVGEGLLPFTREIVQLCTCEVSDYPCKKCRHCQRITQDLIPDYLLIDEETSIKIDQIRQAQQFLSTKPSFLSRKMLLINQAHMMTEEAAHAFLKALEEPPKGAVIILISSRIDKLFPTIISRTRRIYFPHHQQRYAFNDSARVAGFFSHQALTLKERASSRRVFDDLVVLLRDALIFRILKDKKLLLSPDSYEIILPLKTASSGYIRCLEHILKIYDDLDTINLNLASQLILRAAEGIH